MKLSQLSSSLFLLSSLCIGTATAQQTWTVNFLGGPGVNFTDLPTAVAAASSGDTILVQSAIGMGADSFTTDKGLTIVGVGGFVPLFVGPSSPIVIENLPAGESFRMVGFAKSANGQLGFEINDCLGQVHLEQISAYETPMFPNFVPAIEISNSSSVSLREVSTFGYPCVVVDSSTVSLVQCQLGESLIGLGGGQAIHGTGSTIQVTEPRFHTGMGATESIFVDSCDLTIAGDGQGYIKNLGGGDVVTSVGSTVTIDPAVAMAPGAGFATFAGTGVLSTVAVPASWTGDLMAGQTFSIFSTAPAAATLIQVIGQSAVQTATPLGPIGVDLFLPYFLLPAATSPPGGQTEFALNAPAFLPTGATFATQSVVITGAQAQIGLPAVMTVQ